MLNLLKSRRSSLPPQLEITAVKVRQQEVSLLHQKNKPKTVKTVNTVDQFALITLTTKDFFEAKKKPGAVFVNLVTALNTVWP